MNAALSIPGVISTVVIIWIILSLALIGALSK